MNERVAAARRESAALDFKERFDPSEASEWLELIKDIVAMANSGGGLIVVGVCNNGQAAAASVQPVLALDPATVTDKVLSYTGVQFAGFEICETKRGKKRVAVLVIAASQEAPMVFIKPGTYALPDGKKQKTAFSQGTVYFRHGAKSEPGTTDDLRRFTDRRVDKLRKQWIERVRQVVQAPEGARLAIVEPASADASGVLEKIRLTDDPDAPVYGKLTPDQSHPHRQTELLKELNNRLPPDVRVNPHDILCVRRTHGISAASHPKCAYKPRFGSQQYSDEFVDWLYDQWKADHAFFEDAKAKARQQAARGSTRSA